MSGRRQDRELRYHGMPDAALAFELERAVR